MSQVEIQAADLRPGDVVVLRVPVESIKRWRAHAGGTERFTDVTGPAPVSVVDLNPGWQLLLDDDQRVTVER